VRFVLFTSWLFGFCVLRVEAQVSYTGGVVTQDFNTLPTTGSFTASAPGPLELSAAPISASGMVGWSIAPSNSPATNLAKLRADSGSSSAASHLSSGTVASSDRALGVIASSSYVGRSTVTLTNDTGALLTEITVAFTGEQWRWGGSANLNTLTFAYSVNGGAFVAVPSLNFTTRTTTGGTVLDGNAAANRAAISATLTNIPWGVGQTLVLRWSDANEGSDDDTLAIDDFSFSAAAGTLSGLTAINSIQGSGVTSPMVGSAVTIEGIVTGDYQAAAAMGGFYVQAAAVNHDANAATSEGIFVDDNGSYEVALGDVVRVSGTVAEVSGVTTMSAATVIGKVGMAALPSPVSVALPVATTSALERHEGMTVQFDQTLTVTSVSQLGSDGRLTLSSGGGVETPTNWIDPNDVSAAGTTSTGATNAAAINAQESADTRRKLVLDDASTVGYPDITPYFNAQNTRRCGDTISSVTGHFSYNTGENRLQPSAPVVFTDANPRPITPPAVGGRLKVAGMNALNYFLTLGSRGAANGTELQRQQDKLVAQIIGLNADVLGIVEIENLGTTAIDTLVSAINAGLGSAVYARVPEPSGAGGDIGRVAMIYKPATVTPGATSYTDSHGVWNRWPLAVCFTEVSTGAKFIACVNHFKSKSSEGATGLDIDQNDGQSAFNERRRQQATRLLTFLATVKTAAASDNVLVIGDLNAHLQEDPIDILRAGGYVDQLSVFTPGAYSYSFDESRGLLDHAFSSPELASQITGAAPWHINADEPAFLDYTLLGKTLAQREINVGTAYRASDHDPILVGLSLTAPSVSYSSWAASITWPLGTNDTPTGDADGDGMTNLEEFILEADPLVHDRHLRPKLSFSTSTQLSFEYRQRRNTTGYTVVPQWSPDLVTWTDQAAGTVQSQPSATTDLKRLLLDVTGHTRGFMRLHIRP
jgi:predicted extracellular nuclease